MTQIHRQLLAPHKEVNSRHGGPISTSHRPHLQHCLLMRNPQDETQMHNEMGWDATDDITKEEVNQMAQDLSWEVPESHVPAPKVPLGKAVAEQGFASDKTAWAEQ
eukprot:1661380-Karenia_brevis.AAC.1